MAIYKKVRITRIPKQVPSTWKQFVSFVADMTKILIFFLRLIAVLAILNGLIFGFGFLSNTQYDRGVTIHIELSNGRVEVEPLVQPEPDLGRSAT